MELLGASLLNARSDKLQNFNGMLYVIAIVYWEHTGIAHAGSIGSIPIGTPAKCK